MNVGRRTVLVVGGANGVRRGDDPSASVVVWSIDRAVASIGWRDPIATDSLPAIARLLLGQQPHDAICVLPFRGAVQPLAWLESRRARGWIEPAPAGLPDLEALATSIDDALGVGFVGADAVLLGCTNGGLPRLSWGEHSGSMGWDGRGDDAVESRIGERTIGLYAIVDSAAAVARAVHAGISTVQLRIKRPFDADRRWDIKLGAEAISAIAATRAAGAELVLNDHWRLAAQLGIASVHLGQEDIESLGLTGRAAIAESGIRLGISSHSVWELCRARASSTRYIACGPVWPTTTKDMPWLPQGPDNLAWWSRNARRPVVAIGGILDPEQARIAARSGADGVCLVRALGEDPARVVPAFRDAFERGRAERAQVTEPGTPWPHPTLPAGYSSPRR